MTVKILFKIIFIIYLFSVFKRGFLWRINKQRFLSINVSVGAVHSFGMNRVGIKHSTGYKEDSCFEQEGFDALRDKPIQNISQYFVVLVWTGTLSLMSRRHVACERSHGCVK